MKRFEIHGKMGSSLIAVGESFGNIFSYIPKEKTIIITDQNVRRLYEAQFPACPVIEIGMGEGIKTLETMGEIYAKLMELDADRSCFILGIGGGIVCDITGFVASTYLRGVRFGFVSTTLLSQVDASVGGKNGVNFAGYKNMVGTFNQPEIVICDPNMLKTLPQDELCNGFAEIVKHAAIADEEMFAYLEADYDKALRLDADTIEKLVYDSVKIKAAVVNADERESGERRKLNFGHTFGHAVEKTTGIAHGAAVSVGMAIAARLSVQKGLLAQKDADRIGRLLENLKLPIRVSVHKDKISDALKKDKKRENDQIKFVLLDRIGHALVKDISVSELQEVSNDLYQ